MPLDIRTEFGGLAAQRSYTYDYSKMSDLLATLNPQAPLILDIPFAQNASLLESLLPFSRVFNLNQVAYFFNAEQSVESQKLGQVLEDVDAAVDRLDQVVEGLSSFGSVRRRKLG